VPRIEDQVRWSARVLAPHKGARYRLARPVTRPGVVAVSQYLLYYDGHWYAGDGRGPDLRSRPLDGHERPRHRRSSRRLADGHHAAEVRSPAMPAPISRSRSLLGYLRASAMTPSLQELEPPRFPGRSSLGCPRSLPRRLERSSAGQVPGRPGLRRPRPRAMSASSRELALDDIPAPDALVLAIRGRPVTLCW